jgi:hypothetical protein
MYYIMAVSHYFGSVLYSVMSIYEPIVDHRPPMFRQLPSIEPWGADIFLGNLTLDQFKPQVLEAAATTRTSSFGYFTFLPQGGLGYHLSRYPRHAYDIIDTERLQALAYDLADRTTFRRDPQLSIPAEGFRVVMGLRAGYDTQKFYAIADIQRELTVDLSCHPARIYTVRYMGEGKDVTDYSEPAVIIQGPIDEIARVMTVAHQCGQHRFAVETNKEAFIVETDHCTPDPIE